MEKREAALVGVVIGALIAGVAVLGVILVSRMTSSPSPTPVPTAPAPPATPEPVTPPPTVDLQAEVNAVQTLVMEWARAWENNVNSMDWYQSFYSRDFFSNYKSRSGMNYEEWIADKAEKARRTPCIQVEVENLHVSVDGALAKAEFNQRYIGGSYCDTGWKTLYLAKEGGAWKMVGEEQPSTTLCGQRCGAAVSAGGGEKAELVSLVYQWAQAWENNVVSLDQYRRFYSPAFWSNYKARNGMDYNRWMADKANKARKVSCIKVQVNNLSVSREGGSATATFLQKYMSNTYCDSGWKTLYWAREDGRWKIFGEEMGPTTKCGERCY